MGFGRKGRVIPSPSEVSRRNVRRIQVTCWCGHSPTHSVATFGHKTTLECRHLSLRQGIASKTQRKLLTALECASDQDHRKSFILKLLRRNADFRFGLNFHGVTPSPKRLLPWLHPFVSDQPDGPAKSTDQTHQPHAILDDVAHSGREPVNNRQQAVPDSPNRYSSVDHASADELEIADLLRRGFFMRNCIVFC